MTRHPGRLHLLALLGGIGMAAAAAAPDAFARPAHKARKGKEAEKAAVDLEPYRKGLTGDEAKVVETLEAIARAGEPDLAPLVTEVLDRGGTEKVLEAALGAAGKLKAEGLSPSVTPYTRHRADGVRRLAVRTLLKTRGPSAVEALSVALRSPDPVVRGTAASGLGTLGAHAALPELNRAFDHGVAEASAAIGQLCAPPECEAFAAHLGKVTFDVMSGAFDQILFRPPAEMPDETKLRVVGRLRELGTPEAGKYLADVSGRWPEEWSKKLKQAIEAASHSVGGKP